MSPSEKSETSNENRAASELSTFPLFESEHAAFSAKSDDAIFLRLPKVKALTGLSKSSLYDLIRANNFPAPVHLGPRTVAWVSSEVKQWAADRITTSRATSANIDVRRLPQRAVGQPWPYSKKYA